MFEIAGIIILAMWAIAEITEKILVPIGKEGKAATVGGLVVTGVMELLLLMADQLVKIQKKVKS